MRNVRLLIALAAAACGSLMPAAAAAATPPHPAITPHLTTSLNAVHCNHGVDIFGTGFAPNESVSLTVITRSTAAGANRDMVVRVEYTVPDRRDAVTVHADGLGNFVFPGLVFDVVGVATITGTGQTSGASASASVVELLRCAALPVTGDDGTYLRVALIGSAIAAAGAIFVVLTRSRRRRPIRTRP